MSCDGSDGAPLAPTDEQYAPRSQDAPRSTRQRWENTVLRLRLEAAQARLASLADTTPSASSAQHLIPPTADAIRAALSQAGVLHGGKKLPGSVPAPMETPFLMTAATPMAATVPPMPGAPPEAAAPPSLPTQLPMAAAPRTTTPPPPIEAARPHGPSESAQLYGPPAPAQKGYSSAILNAMAAARRALDEARAERQGSLAAGSGGIETDNGGGGSGGGGRIGGAGISGGAGCRTTALALPDSSDEAAASGPSGSSQRGAEVASLSGGEEGAGRASGATPAAEDCWQAATWASGLGLPALVAEHLMSPLAALGPLSDNETEIAQLAYLRELGGATGGATGGAMGGATGGEVGDGHGWALQLLQDAPGRLAARVEERARKLCDASASVGELSAKFQHLGTPPAV